MRGVRLELAGGTGPIGVKRGIDENKPRGHWLTTIDEISDHPRGQCAARARAPEGEGTRYSRDQPPLPRDFVQQPPLIPHTIKGYTVTKNFNKCLDCHAWARAKETGATKISVTHFKTREGEELSSVSPRRYFCNQCHVPQSDAKPLVGNSFKPGTGMR